MNRTKLQLRSHDALGSWLYDGHRFYESAHLLLKELVLVSAEVNQKWPIPLGETVRNGGNYPEWWSVVRRRDMLSVSIIIFSAMAVEAFLNFYGVVRIGEKPYT